MINVKDNFCYIEGMKTKISSSETNEYIKKYLELGQVLYLMHENKKTRHKLGFTIGMHKLYNLPELVAMGPNIEMSGNLLKVAARYLQEKKEKLPHGTVLDDLLLFNLKIGFIDVSEDIKKDLMTEVYNIYGHWDFEAQQILITDPKGNFPWNKDYNKKMRIIQRVFGDISGLS